jgi:hypothetical protein
MSKRQEIARLNLDDVKGLLERAKGQLSAEDFELLTLITQVLTEMTRLVRERGTSIKRLRRLFGLSCCEKISKVLNRKGEKIESQSNQETPAESEATEPAVAATGETADTEKDPEKPKQKGNKGRIPSSAYTAADQTEVPHESLSCGDRCPKCDRGNMGGREPSQIIRIFGQPPLVARCWNLESLRCNSCGFFSTAKTPAEARGPKYDETAGAMTENLHYGFGMPFARLEEIQKDLETPVPTSTQWDLVKGDAESGRPVFEELIRISADSPTMHNDDSYARVLSLMGERRAATLEKDQTLDPKRTGIFTTAIVSIMASGEEIALFFTGRNHAGENIANVLDNRDKDLPPPQQMSDGLDRNLSNRHEVVWLNCMGHARRGVVDEVENFPVECRIFLETIAVTFANDKAAKDQKMTPNERMRFHMQESAPRLIMLKRWIRNQFRERRIEPNSDLGSAMKYFLKHWKALTQFWRRPGVPLTNNLCERVLKMAIRYRNNSYFYRSENGAKVGDIFMSLIFTAKLNGANPFDYITEILRNEKAVAECPGNWLPWTYRATLDRINSQRTKVAA